MKSNLKVHALALSVVAALSGVMAMAPNTAAAETNTAAPAEVTIPYEQFTLPNGLKVIVHTDRKAPIVAVNIWYHVGSKDEPAGRSGFAHLFEHLMFNGSENHKGEYFGPFEQVGATDMNGTTNTDRTNYFQNVPTTALDMALWMESDRMGHMLGAIDQKTLDEQRGVVQNEKRQGENQPYGQLRYLLVENVYPKGHPYHHSTIGSMNDLNAASLDDVKNWFRAWYGPNNAVLVLAGDIDVPRAKELTMKYFGDIPASATVAQPKVNIPKRETTRQVVEDNVPQVRIFRAWPVAESTHRDADRLDLLSSVLGGSKSSRLDKRLVHEEKLVDSVGASVNGSQLSSMFMIYAAVKDGVDPARVEKIIDEELNKLIKDGPTAQELEQARASARAGFIRGVERIGGFGGKADVLAACATYEGNPGCYKDSMEVYNTATAADIKGVGRKYLQGNGSHTIVFAKGKRTPLVEAPAVAAKPMALPPVDRKYKVTPSDVDRSKGVQIPTEFPDLTLPTLERATLVNGAQVILARRPEIPVVNINWMFNGGYSSDPRDKLGLANMTLGLIDEGAGDLDSLAFASRAESLGANLNAGASLDGATASLSAIKDKLDPSLELFANMLQRPRFDQKEIDRVKATWIAGIKQEKATPNGLSNRIMPGLLYGKNHPYGIPSSGTGTEQTAGSLTRNDMLGYAARYLRPEGSTVVVVGDTTLAEIVPKLNSYFGKWKGVGTAPTAVSAATVDRPAKTKVYLVDQPGSVQANIFGGQLQVPPTADEKDVMLEIANEVIGGSFTSRLNMNLREDKHWSYGARTGLRNALGQRNWIVSAPVQIDKAAESLTEAVKEVTDLSSGKRPVTAEEVGKIRANELRSLPGSFETAASVSGMIMSNVRYGRPDSYINDRSNIIESMQGAQIDAAAKAFDPSKMVWLVIGDLSKMEKQIRDLNLGPVEILDAEGNPVTR